MKTIDEVIEKLLKDNKCSKYMLDWIVARIDDIEYGGIEWKLKKIKNGYNLSCKNDSFDYFYNSFYQPL